MPRDYSKEEAGFKQKLIRFPDELWGRVQEFRWSERIKDDAEAVRRLVDEALTAKGFPPDPAKKPAP